MNAPIIHATQMQFAPTCLEALNVLVYMDLLEVEFHVKVMMTMKDTAVEKKVCRRHYLIDNITKLFSFITVTKVIDIGIFIT